MRHFVCFVCFKKFDELQAFNKHVVETHDHGKHYVLCQEPHCGTPVRDLKAHYRVFHPHRPFPKNEQHTAVVWKDCKTKKTRKKPSFKEGFFTSKKNGGAEIYYRSGYEKKTYELLEHDLEVTAYSAEPFKIPYLFEGAWHNYTPDLKITYKDKNIEICEIKPASQTQMPKNIAKWDAMSKVAQSHGWRFQVITEKGIRMLEKKDIASAKNLFRNPVTLMIAYHLTV